MLAEGAHSSEALAHRVGAHPRALYRVLRALACLGLFAETPEGRFEMTPLALPLQTNAPESLRALAIMWGETFWRPYGELLQSVRTGEVAFRHVHGMGLFDYLQHHPQAGEIFHAAMTNLTRPHAAAVLTAYDFTDIATVVDVGGRNGTLLSAILHAYPQMGGCCSSRRTCSPVRGRRWRTQGCYRAVRWRAGIFSRSYPVEATPTS